MVTSSCRPSFFSFSVVITVVSTHFCILASHAGALVCRGLLRGLWDEHFCLKGLQPCQGISSHLSKLTAGHQGLHTTAAGVAAVHFQISCPLVGGKVPSDPPKCLTDVALLRFSCLFPLMLCPLVFPRSQLASLSSCLLPHLSFAHKTQSSQQMIH